jgi:hypothetical protein
MTGEATSQLLAPSGTGLTDIPARPSDGWLADRPRPLILGLGGTVAAFLAGALATYQLRYGLAFLAALVLVVVVLLRPFLGGLALVGLVPILSGLTPGVPVPYVRVSEGLIGLIGATLLVSARRDEAVPWGALDWLLLAYGALWAFYGALDGIALGEHLTLSDWGTVFGQLQFFLLYRGVRVALRSPRERRLALIVLIAASAPVALLAVLQELHFPGIAGFITTITGGVSGPANAVGSVARATGPFNNWAILAGYLFPLLLSLWALSLAGQLHRRRALWAVAALALTGLLLTAELSAITCLLIGAVILASQYGHRRKALKWLGALFIVATLVAGPFLFSRLNQELSSTAGSSRPAGVPQTLNFRWGIWSGQYFPAIEQRPLTGYGVVLPSSIHWVYPESQYVSFLMEGGAPMLALFALLAWAMVERSRAAARSSDPLEQALGRSLLVVVVAALVMNAIWPYLSNGGLPQVLWCLFAIASPCPTRVPVSSERNSVSAETLEGARSTP